MQAQSRVVHPELLKADWIQVSEQSGKPYAEANASVEIAIKNKTVK